VFSSPGTQSTAFALRHLDRKCHLRSASAPEHNLVRAFVQRHASCCRRELQVCHRGDIEAHCGAGSRRDGADAIEVDETLERQRVVLHDTTTRRDTTQHDTTRHDTTRQDTSGTDTQIDTQRWR
jgi:hypothetical protein